ncbi:DnaE-like error-prone DNA polymerase [Azospira oryzae]|uniref:Error-prone DNA polymerase n=1 Tax=Azospira oryzae TaxID=146939 RepID=A0ABY0IRN0_9RHOO|nr:error-prone DNA polymerase [Azospira oryzae]RZT89666.1 DnaE-like error-prone DNA polymerase [Azospira oryzae]
MPLPETTLPPALPDYAELHCLSNFSFLRGASHPEELVQRAVELGYGALAVTDECSFAGSVRAHVAAKAVGFKLIHGTEIVLADGLKLVLLAQNREGYGNLSALITLARRRAEKGAYRLTRGDLEGFGPSGALPDCLALWVPSFNPDPADGRWLAQRFPNRAWLAVELHAGPDDRGRLEQLQQLAADCGLPLLAAGDVHMHSRARRPLQDVLTALRLNTTVFAAGHALHPNGERHLRPRLRLARLYPPELLAETLAVAARCTFSLDELRYEYPEEVVPHGLTPAAYLRQEVEAGLAVRYPDGVPEKARAQVEYELGLIARLQYEAYFLTVYDIVRFARSREILCQGRGSAANSAVCYALGITEVDPAKSELLFERFISAERGEPPDIDVDFEHQRREEVIQYLYEKYGRERAALTGALITYRTRGALRDAGRALGFGREQIDALANTLAWWDKQDELPDRLRAVGLDPESPRVAKWLAVSRALRGFPRHLSQHVGGFVISRGPLSRLVPIENAAMAERSVIQWDKDDIDALGLMKVDVLALGMLSAIRRALDMLGARDGKPVRLQDIPRESKAVYDMLCRGDSLGIFQVESRAQMAMLPRLKPRQFYDLVVQVAIVRPGPIQGDMVHPYLKRRHGEEKIEKISPAVDKVLERTYGVPIFQEQVMQLAVVAAGFTPGEADQLRRAMAAWKRKGGLEPFEQKLIRGMQERGLPESFARRIFEQIKGFGDYGFPESHAASFAILVYFSAWLKRFEPAAFLCGLLNAHPMGFYAPAQLVQDAQRHGVTVLPPDVTHSAWESLLVELLPDHPPSRPRTVRLGLREIAGFNQAAAERIVAARQDGPFASVADLAARAGLQRPELERLAAANALQALAGHRRAAAWESAAVENTGQPRRHGSRSGHGQEAEQRKEKGSAKALGNRSSASDAANATGRSKNGMEEKDERGHALPIQGDLFAALPPPAEAPPPLPTPTEGEDLVADYATLGLTLGRHPLALLRDRLTAGRFITAAELRAAPDKKLARAAGIVTHRQRPGTASGIVFVTMEDETGPINVILRPELVEKQRRETLAARLLGVYGQLESHHGVTHLVAKRLVDLTPLLGRLATRSRDFH